MHRTRIIRTREFNSFDEFARFATEFVMNGSGYIVKKTRKVKHYQQPKQESGIFQGLKMYYNPEKKVFTIIGPRGRKATVHKNKEDKEDIEKAMLYCLLKYYGVKPREIWNHYSEIHLQSNPTPTPKQTKSASKKPSQKKSTKKETEKGEE